MPKTLPAMAAAVALLATGCMTDYALKQGAPAASLYLEDGPSLQSYLYISRDSARCTYLEAVEHQYTRRPSLSRVGPYRVEADRPLAVAIRGIHASSLYSATTCDVIFDSTFQPGGSYLIKIVETAKQCGVLVFDITQPDVKKELPVNYRRYKEPAFSSSPACVDGQES